MPRVFVLGILLVSFIHLNAQTEAGNFMLGGGLDFFQQKKAASESEFIALDLKASVNVGYFVIPNFSIGLEGIVNAVPENSFEYGGSFYSRYYFPIKPFFKPFFHAGIGWTMEQIESPIPGLDTRLDRPFLEGRIGGATFLTQQVSLDTFFYYKYLSEIANVDDGSSFTNAFHIMGIGLNFQIFL